MEAIDLTLEDVGVPKDHAIDLTNTENKEGEAKGGPRKRKVLGKGLNIQESPKHTSLQSTHQADPAPQADDLAWKIDNKPNSSIPLVKKGEQVRHHHYSKSILVVL
jgi:hypothetical protein